MCPGPITWMWAQLSERCDGHQVIQGSLNNQQVHSPTHSSREPVSCLGCFPGPPLSAPFPLMASVHLALCSFLACITT